MQDRGRRLPPAAAPHIYTMSEQLDPHPEAPCEPVEQQHDGLAVTVFEQRASSIVELLKARLDSVFDEFDLTKRDLLAANRNGRVVSRRGRQDPASYWKTVAVPAADRLRLASIDVIDEETEQLCVEWSRVIKLDPSLSGHAKPTAEEHLRMLPSTLPPADHINDLGAWWQKRLRRAASLRAAWPILLSPVGQSELLIDKAELELADSDRWVYSDRLLSAFERAHVDIRQHMATRTNHLIARLGSESGKGLRADRRGRRAAASTATTV